jgi:hypothetical protein
MPKQMAVVMAITSQLSENQAASAAPTSAIAILADLRTTGLLMQNSPKFHRWNEISQAMRPRVALILGGAEPTTAVVQVAKCA